MANGARRLLFLGQLYLPKIATQPIRKALLTGALEKTNAVCNAKIAGQALRALRQQYGFDAISLMPTNLYGPGDNYTSAAHVYRP